MAKFSFVLIALTATCALTNGALLHRFTRQAGTCGKPGATMRANAPVDGDGRIVGGVEARPHSHPWIISLQQYGSHFCGGTLIRNPNMTDASNIVVTAAHCLYEEPRGLTASAGSHNFDRPPKTEMTVYGQRYMLHPQYNPQNQLNDIAVVKLEMPIKFSATVQPACLPTAGEVVAENTQGTVAGWGHNREGAMSTARTLMQVGVPIINHKTCAMQYRTSGMMISEKEMMCAGFPSGGKDSCQGDSGGPFVFPSGQSWVLQGVVSFGEGCARAGKPGVYARVSNYLKFINDAIAKLHEKSG